VATSARLCERLLAHETMVDMLLELGEVYEVFSLGSLSGDDLRVLRWRVRSMEDELQSLTTTVPIALQVSSEMSTVGCDEVVTELLRRLVAVQRCVPLVRAKLEKVVGMSLDHPCFDELVRPWRSGTEGGPDRCLVGQSNRKVLGELTQPLLVSPCGLSEEESNH